MTNSSRIKFRPHHFLCTLCFQGKGYSPEFVRNYKHILEQLSDDTKITIVQETDSICSPCPHKRESKCVSQEKIELLDTQHAKALQLDLKNKDNNLSLELTWKQAKNLIKKNMTLEKFHKICAPCEWKKYGICEKVLTKFLTD